MDNKIRGGLKPGRASLVALGLCLLSLVASPVFALGIGSIKLDSALNQPLKAEIEILGVQGNELETLGVALAAQDVYDRMGIERAGLLDKLQFRVEQKPDTTHYIRVFTTEPVNEPFLNFLIEVNWANGRLLREFTVLLDPPLFGEEEAAPVESPETMAPPEVTIPERDTGEGATAPSPPPVMSVAPALEAPVPSEAIEYGKIKRGENLWKIAQELKPSDVSIEQMMLALYRANPEAFFGDNISMLKEGAVLRLDNLDQAKRISVQEAIAEVNRHHQDWLAYRRDRMAQQAVAAESVTQKPVGTPEPTLAAPGVRAGEPRLELVTPAPEQLETGETAGTEGVGDKLTTELNQVRIELAMSTEMLEAARQENNELRKRVNALEGQLQSMNSLISLKDRELSAMQQDVAPEEQRESLLPSLDLESEAGGAAAPRPAREMPEPSIWDDPLTIGTLVALALIPAVFALVSRRRKSAAKEKKAGLSEAVFAESDSDVVREISDFEQEQATQEANVDLNAITDLGFADSEPDSGKDTIIDPISEADVYLAYGKYDKAEALLTKAIDSDPDRHELKLKLLEVYSLSGDQSRFDERAEELYAALGGDASHPLWDKAKELARDVSAENPLFGTEQGADSIEISSEAIDFPESEVPEVESEEVLAAMEELAENVAETSELDIAEAPESKPLTLEDASKPWAPDRVTEFKPETRNEPDTEFVTVGYRGRNDSQALESVSELDLASKPEFEHDLRLEDEIAILSDEEEDVEAIADEFEEKARILQNIKEDEFSNVFAEDSSAVSAPGKQFDDSSMFLLDDEVGTKLDLARAYIEMGDREGARELLLEVEEEGNDKQKRDAKVLLSMAH